MNTRELVLISVLILLIPVALFVSMDGSSIGDFGSLMGAFIGLIAVIWFYRSLRLQSIQIEEQRIQFSKQYSLQHQDSLLAFLDKSSDRMQNSLSELIESLDIPDASQIFVAYLGNMQYYKLAFESTDPNIVKSEIEAWLKIEGPCVKFMSAVRDIIILHKRRLGLEDNHEGIDVAEYVYINGSHLMNQPFMSSYKNSVDMLSEQMNLIVPGRKAMALAASAAMAQLAPEGIMKEDKIIEDIKKAKADGAPIAKICNALYC